MCCAAATTRRPCFFFAGVKTPLHEILIKFLSCVRTLRARQEIRCAFWRERRAGRCKAPRRRRCGDIVEERQRRRCPPAAAPLRAAARKPAGCVARSLHTAAGMLVARALPAGLGASSKMYTLFPDGPLTAATDCRRDYSFCS